MQKNPDGVVSSEILGEMKVGGKLVYWEICVLYLCPADTGEIIETYLH